MSQGLDGGMMVFGSEHIALPSLILLEVSMDGWTINLVLACLIWLILRYFVWKLFGEALVIDQLQEEEEVGSVKTSPYKED